MQWMAPAAPMMLEHWMGTSVTPGPAAAVHLAMASVSRALYAEFPPATMPVPYTGTKIRLLTRNAFAYVKCVAPTFHACGRNTSNPSACM